MPFVYEAALVAQGLSILALPLALYVEYSSHGIATTLKAWSYCFPTRRLRRYLFALP